MSDLTGKLALCSRGRLGVVEGRKELEWGLSWVGTGVDGTPWASREPRIVCDADASLVSRMANAASALVELGELVHGPEMPFYPDLPQTDLASRSYVTLAMAVDEACAGKRL